ncbi:MAG: replicative DNA helicase [Clostridia bacterium]|jgi:replicative DNA helicase|nr:replicative DNA helicase [Clostridia bacterium]
MDKQILGKVPPHSIEAEQSVIGSMMIDPDAILVAVETLNEEDFYKPSHRELFKAMKELYMKNEPVDLVTIKNKIEEKGVLNEIGGINYLSEMIDIVPTSARIKTYVAIVEEKSVLRKLIRAGRDISAASYEGEEGVDSILDMAEKSIFNIMENKSSEDFAEMRDVLMEAFEQIENIYTNDQDVTGVSTGFSELDHRTSGMQPSDLVLVAARPSMGKTALAINMAQYASTRKNVPVAIFSLEMSKTQLINRMLCTEAMVDAQKVRTGNLSQDDWVKITRAMGPLSEAPVYIDDTPGISIMEMRAKCRRLKMEKGLGMIVIDYLQLMSGSGKTESRQQEISDISRNLKALARELSVPVIALSQLSRACESRADRRPMLSDLRESGAIEQDADVVMFLYRDEYYNPDTTEFKNQAEVIIAKQRNGPTGTVHLAWLGQYTKFANLQQ